MPDNNQPQHSVLGQVALGYSPVVNTQRQVVATRVTVFAVRGEAPANAQSLLQALYSVWPVPPEPEIDAAQDAPSDEGPLNLTLRVVDEAAAAAAAVAASKAHGDTNQAITAKAM